MDKGHKNEYLLWFGKWTSKLGNIVFDYANSVSIVGAFSHTPWVLALYQSSETVIQILFNLIGGAKADSGSRKKMLVITDLLSALICLAVSFFCCLAAHGGSRYHCQRAVGGRVCLQFTDLSFYRPRDGQH